MKRAIAFIISVIICLYTVGCTKGDMVESRTDNDLTVKTPIDKTIIEPVLPASAKKTSIEGLYIFENGIDYFTQANNSSVTGDVLHLEFITPGLDTITKKIVTYSLSEDKVLGEIDFPEGSWLTGDLDNGGFYSVSLTSTEVTFYDRNCNITFNKKIYDSDFMWNYVTVSGDGKYLLYVRALDGSLVLYSFSDGTEDIIGDEKGVFVPIGYKGGYFYLRNYESGIFKVSPEKKSLETIVDYDVNGFINTEYCISESNSYYVITPLEDAENRRMTPVKNENEMLMAANENCFAAVYNDQEGSKLRIYNMQMSTASPQIPIPGFIQNVLFCGRNLLLIISHDTDAEKTLYYLYDLTDLSGFEDIVLSEADDSILNEFTVPEWTGDSETIEYAKSILDEYGVRVIYGTTGVDFESSMYTSKPVDDLDVLPRIKNIEEVLKLFPEGMLQEIGRGQEIWIYLCKEIADADTGRTASGYAMDRVRYSLICIDVVLSDEVFKETLIHEFSHVMDYCLDISFLNGWINLMPENIADNAYMNSYNDTVDFSYTPFGSGDNEVWFYDSYSRTFPTEDRAVIFQKMYLSYVNEELTDEFEKYENLRKKALYYCEMIRNTFDSCKDKDILPWEEPFSNS